MGVEHSITIDSEEFRNYEGVKINYSNIELENTCFTIQSHGLLFENDIRDQPVECFETNGHQAFFNTSGGDIPFDIFAASFYLLSRYEEYLPHTKDMYGRYAHENSLAFKEGFLNLPIINIWVKDLVDSLMRRHLTSNLQPNPERSRRATSNFLPTYDIDIAYSYKHKGLLRNIGGFIMSPSVERVKVLFGLKKDPFDSYSYLDIIHEKYHLKPLYFFLVADKNSKYDKNILPHKEAIWRLVKKQSKKSTAGLHPSWQSGDDLSLLKREKQQLEAMCEATIYRSRQHYIRFNLPGGYRRLADAGITDDYSMGYGSINGFRASVASSFYWYDLEKEEQTSLRIHPYCYMEANSYYEQKLSAEEAYKELMHYYHQCKEMNGTLITIFHNNFFGDDMPGWREMYERFLAQVEF